MNLSPAYERWREETLQEGRLEEQLPSEDLTHLLLTLSREELLERFGG